MLSIRKVEVIFLQLVIFKISKSSSSLKERDGFFPFFTNYWENHKKVNDLKTQVETNSDNIMKLSKAQTAQQAGIVKDQGIDT